ncbi:MAG: peptidoglycan DD-metalloendopeptidase family protein [Rhizobiaceae bacterium]|nr:peptidoglycan DD-metalloendopeptidase family protein [Rhizobiaceae bacterium]
MSASFAQQEDDLELKRDQRLQELQELRAAITIGDQRRAELADEISQIDKDRVSINRSMIETSKKARALEKRVSRSSRRLSQLRDEQAEVRGFLKTKEALLLEILAALQRMGRAPPPALLVSPDDALSSVRSAILLGSVVPEVRSETEILIGQLQDLVRISNEITERRDALRTDLASLADEEERLNLLLVEKQNLSGIAQAKLAEEQAKAAELAAEASSLNELISTLETQVESARKAAEASRLAEIERQQREANRTEAATRYQNEEAFSDVGRTAPALAFSAARGLLPLPVNGDVASSFGEEDEFGEDVLGVNLVSRENARVLTPADGWILYAGPFRTYGKLLIIDAGNGYHIVLAGLEEVNVRPGQFVIVGEPIGKMGAKRIANAGVIDVSTTKPILYVEFRKDGKPIDPSPWWADTNIQRVADGS